MTALTLADTLPATASKQDDANTALGQILGELQSQRTETVWTDNSGAYYIRLDNGGSISWVTPTGAASSGPGAGAKPVGSGTIISDTTRWQAVHALAGAYAIGDYLSHVVTTDSSTGTVLANFWINTTTGAALAAAPASADIGAVAPLPVNAATANLQASANTTLGQIASPFIAASTPALTGTINDTLPHVIGPFTPQLARDICLTLNATSAASGTAQLLRSVDGGATQPGLTVAGAPWGRFAFSAITGVIVNEPVWQETSAAATIYLAITLSAGVVTYNLHQ